MFQVGDRIVVIMETSPHYGWAGVVTEIWDRDSVYVALDGYEIDQFFYTSQLAYE